MRDGEEMGRRGPKPKTKALRVFEGDPGNLLAARHAGEIDPPKVSEAPDPPLSMGLIAAEKWREVAGQLVALGVLTSLDLGELEIYCDYWELYTVAKQDVARDGAFILLNARTGKSGPHPSIATMNAASDRMKQHGQLLGLNPVSRIGLKVEPQPEPVGGLDDMVI